MFLLHKIIPYKWLQEYDKASSNVFELALNYNLQITGQKRKKIISGHIQFFRYINVPVTLKYDTFFIKPSFHYDEMSP